MNSKRNIIIPPDQYERIQKAAAEEGARQGRTVPVSEWIREACRQRIAREGA